ncbi:MAG: hypothetical protein ACXVBW_13910 [Bdellovibrionota bacterium]
MTTSITSENFRQGFLVDEELMAGVMEDPDHAGTFIAFVLRHTSGEYLGFQPFPTLEEAAGAINRIPRSWTFEKTSGGCGGGNCGKAGGCKGGGCGLKKAQNANPEAEAACATGACPGP